MDMTKKLTKDLIEMYWERRCLWQVNSNEYKKRDMKKKAYQEIVMFLRRNGVKDATVKLVREKIQNLRRAMRKEKKRIDSSGGAYSPTLWYYDLLIFVNDQYEDTAPGTDPSKFVEDKCGTEIVCTDSDEDYSIDDNINEINKCTYKLQSQEVLSEPGTSKDKNSTKDSVNERRHATEFEAIGINFAAKLKRMESKQQIFAELLIQKVLARGLLGQLKDTTDIVDKT